MSRFALAIEYLTGYAVATDPASRERAEWPPHPARVFMALAAAHFETDDSPETKAAERAALEWLAGLSPPSLVLPRQASSDFASPRQVLTVYVPVNDATGEKALPSKRPRQPRTFPRVFVGNEPIRLVWSGDAEFFHLDALEGLCRKVTRIGHSSSLVWVRLERDVDQKSVTHEPAEDLREFRLRITGSGALERLRRDFNADRIVEYSTLEREVATAKSKKDAKAAKDRLAVQFPLGQPMSQRPVFSISRGYRPVRPDARAAFHSPFDPNFIVLREADESPQSFGLESTLLITQALRGLIQKESGIQPIPDWISGHDGPNGPRLADGRSHMALIPLPFVQPWRPNEKQYADGHIMGLAIVLPRDVPPRDRAKAFGNIFFDEKNNEPRGRKLTLGRAGELWLVRETSFAPKYNLRVDTWTRAADRWVSVTPIVLDRMPKEDRQNRAAWNQEVAQIIAASCKNQNLPGPIAIRIEKTPLVVGSLRAMPGQGGFPLLRPGTFQVHAEIEFDEAVQGPVLIGAGRFRGYGLCRPITSGAL